MLGILAPFHGYFKSQKQAWTLSHEAYEEMRENEINTRNKPEGKGYALYLGHIGYEVSLGYLNGEIKQTF